MQRFGNRQYLVSNEFAHCNEDRIGVSVYILPRVSNLLRIISMLARETKHVNILQITVSSPILRKKKWHETIRSHPDTTSLGCVNTQPKCYSSNG